MWQTSPQNDGDSVKLKAWYEPTAVSSKNTTPPEMNVISTRRSPRLFKSSRSVEIPAPLVRRRRSSQAPPRNSAMPLIRKPGTPMYVSRLTYGLENLESASRVNSSKKEKRAPTPTISPTKLIQFRKSDGVEFLGSLFMSAG